MAISPVKALSTGRIEAAAATRSVRRGRGLWTCEAVDHEARARIGDRWCGVERGTTHSPPMQKPTPATATLPQDMTACQLTRVGGGTPPPSGESCV